MIKLEAINVSVTRAGLPVLKNVSASIEELTITACIGPQGCGRGTFLRLFNRLDDSSDLPYHRSGEVKVDFKLVEDIDEPALRRRVGMLFRQPSVFAGSIFDNVSFGLKIQGVRHKKFLAEVVERCLQQTGLWSQLKDILQQPVYRLNLAQQQFLCLARALALEPSVLLMEEPTFHLDSTSAYRMEELIYNLKKKVTILLSTNSAQQASRLSDQTAFFYSGELVEFDETSLIFTNPGSARTENYITGRFS